MILYLFFKSLFAFVLLPPGIIFYHRYNRKNLKKKYQETLNSQFKDALLSISAALRAGYSMENALKESEAVAIRDELEKRFGHGISIQCEVDPSLIGGVRVEVEGRVIDGSIRNKLEQIKDVMNG